MYNIIFYIFAFLQTQSAYYSVNHNIIKGIYKWTEFFKNFKLFSEKQDFAIAICAT
jgi:hypothetical protein